ncbi:hypothetical protein AB0B45_46520 [Nonomuraea sp. NPDC049152]|uniref:hypothetical protein n=1 Tax=Nonomuraea sp. NPDC049152 TaxID=3154350 RepID=UPI0033E595D1
MYKIECVISSRIRRSVRTPSRLAAALGFLAVTSMTAAGSAYAAASEPSISPAPLASSDPGPEHWKKQRRTDLVADAIQAAADKLSGDSGFTEAIVHPEQLNVTLLWHGNVPPAVKAAYTKVARAQGVNVSVVQARYTQRQLRTAMDAVTADNKAHMAEFATAGLPRVFSVGPSADGNGLDVSVEAPGDSLAPSASADVAARIASVAGGIPARVRTGAAPQAVSRDNEQNYGGGRWGTSVFGGQGHCSEGFAVRQAGTGFTYMLTAAHCANEGAAATSAATGARFATVVLRDADFDTELLRPPNSQPTFFGPQIWVGGAHEGVWRGNVHGVASNRRNDYVCQSGAFSGVTCGIITEPYTNITLSDGQTFYGEAHYVSLYGYNPLLGPGDSGGPVYTPDGGPEGYVYANGTNSAATDSGITCQGDQDRGTYPDGGPVMCGNHGWYANITSFLHDREPSFSLLTR